MPLSPVLRGEGLGRGVHFFAGAAPSPPGPSPPSTGERGVMKPRRHAIAKPQAALFALLELLQFEHEVVALRLHALFDHAVSCGEPAVDLDGAVAVPAGAVCDVIGRVEMLD